MRETSDTPYLTLVLLAFFLVSVTIVIIWQTTRINPDCPIIDFPSQTFASDYNYLLNLRAKYASKDLLEEDIAAATDRLVKEDDSDQVKDSIELFCSPYAFIKKDIGSEGKKFLAKREMYYLLRGRAVWFERMQDNFRAVTEFPVGALLVVGVEAVDIVGNKPISPLAILGLVLGFVLLFRIIAVQNV